MTKQEDIIRRVENLEESVKLLTKLVREQPTIKVLPLPERPAQPWGQPPYQPPMRPWVGPDKHYPQVWNQVKQYPDNLCNYQPDDGTSRLDLMATPWNGLPPDGSGGHKITLYDTVPGPGLANPIKVDLPPNPDPRNFAP